MLKKRMIVPMTMWIAMAAVAASRADDDTPAGARHIVGANASTEFSTNDGAGTAGSARTPTAFAVESATPRASHSNLAPQGGNRHVVPSAESPRTVNRPISGASNRAPNDAAGVVQGSAVIAPKS